MEEKESSGNLVRPTTEENTEENTNQEPLKEKVEKIDAELYEKRKNELADMERRIDKKTKELNNAVDEYRREGKGFAEKNKPTKLTDKEYRDKVMSGEIPNPNA